MTRPNRDEVDQPCALRELRQARSGAGAAAEVAYSTRRCAKPSWSGIFGASSPEHAFQRHNGHQWRFILSGQLHVAIRFDDYELDPGDAVSLEFSTPHRLYNVASEPVHAIWFVLGPQGVDAA